MAERTGPEGDGVVVSGPLPGDGSSPPQLRVDLDRDTLHVPSGETVELGLTVVNTSSVIETISIELLELMAVSVLGVPDELTLFPDESVEVTLLLTFHRTLPAGEHEGLLVVSGTSGQVAPAEVAVRVEVPPSPAAVLRAEPPLRTAGRKATFELLVSNDGNTALTLQVHAADADRALALELEQSILNLRVDESDGLRLVARRKRHWTGAPVEHLITVDATGGGVSEQVEVRFRQKPRLTAGVITILTLTTIVALWALAMVFGVQTALAPSPPTKMLPENFLAGVGLDDLDPTVSGGSVAGTITAATTAKPVARATIEAFDQQGRLVAATSTDDDGAFVLDGLLPVRHRLRVRAPGFEELWWPASSSASGASVVRVSPTEPTDGLDARIVGSPGSLGGQAIAGDGDALPITVEVVALDLLEPAEAATITADGQGVWSASGLPAPATYRITYRAEGYAPVEIVQPLGAGEQVVVNTTRLPAAVGSIAGLVVDRDGVPVGGVEILAQRGETSLTFTTPTSGDVGFFSLEDLTTPGTYLLTLTADGYASETRAVRLGPGQVLEDLAIVLGPATGTVTGRSLTAAGTPLGAATVTVSGGGTVLSTDTLTSGEIGSFRLAGLPLPGVYAVSFDLAGYQRETVQVQLDDDTPEVSVEVHMVPSVGAIDGLVVDDVTGDPLGAVTIEISDGAAVRTTTTASVPLADRGTFHVGELSPGTYTVTARTPAGQSITVLQTVRAGATTTVTLRVGGLP